MFLCWLWNYPTLIVGHTSVCNIGNSIVTHNVSKNNVSTKDPLPQCSQTSGSPMWCSKTNIPDLHSSKPWVCHSSLELWTVENNPAGSSALLHSLFHHYVKDVMRPPCALVPTYTQWHSCLQPQHPLTHFEIGRTVEPKRITFPVFPHALQLFCE